MKTVAQLRREIFESIWPSGQPENLALPITTGGKSAHKLLFEEGLADLQKWIEGDRGNQVNVFPFCATHFKCGLTVFDAPDGIIDRVYTIANENWCDGVFYRPKDWPEPERWSRNLLTFTAPLNVGFPKLPSGYFFAEKSTDSTCGRARVGIYALFKKKIHLAPWIQSNEAVVVEWRGLKTEWADEDPVNEHIEFRTAMRLYMRYAHERDYGDMNTAASFLKLYEDKRADLMHEDNIKTRRPLDIEYVDWRARTAAELADDAVPAVEETTFAHIGNYGGASANTKAVADMIRSFAPEFIVTGGDNIDTGTYDDEVGKYFHSFIYPYSGVYGQGASLNLFYPAAGDKDWNKNDLADYLSFFHLGDLVQERYYDFIQGDAHFFVLDSDDRETDGNTSGSDQGVWLQAKLAVSTAAWKIVIIHHPPYSSGGSGSYAGLQWPFEAWGANIVIAAHQGVYERLSVTGFPYIVNGLGGMPVDAFSTPLGTSVTRYNDNFGALIGKVSSERLLLQFYNSTSLLIDEIELLA